MKKNLTFFAFLVILCLSYLGCRKSQNQVAEIPSPKSDQTLIQEAKRYFQDSVSGQSGGGKPLSAIGIPPGGEFNPLQLLIKNPVWAKARVQYLTVGPVVVIPLQFNDDMAARPSNSNGSTRLSINKLCNLIIYSDSRHSKHAEIVMGTPDQDFIDKKSLTFTGVTFVTDWSGNYLKSYKYWKGGFGKLTLEQRKVTPNSPPVEGGCTETDWYSCSGTNEDPYQYCSYTGSTYEGCDGGGGDGGGDGGDGVPTAIDYTYVGGNGSTSSIADPSTAIAFAGPTTPVSIAQEMQCFSTQSGSTYSLTICVEEPVPGSGDAVSRSLNAGHTYLTFEQDKADGTKIIRSEGFYPSTYSNPISPGASSVYGDNSNTFASATLKITVNSTDFMAAVNSIQGQTNHNYNLYTYNCTTAAENVLGDIGINGLYNYPAGSLFTGDYPGNLGTTIRNTNASSFSELNGNRPVSINLSGGNSILSPQKAGTCN